ncbi:MAG TPA: histone deacetylase family protein [Actinomycetota bacterium]
MHVVATGTHRDHAPRTEFVLGEVVPAYEVPERVDRILEAVSEAHPVSEPTEHGRSPLERIHDPAYLDHLASAWRDWVAEGGAGPLAADTFALPDVVAGPRPRGAEARVGAYTFDASTPILEGTWRAAAAAADCALTGADLLLGGERAAYALCRPPGHHAGRTFAGGYCYLNSAAAAAAALREEAGPVAILDVDYHHGNGTQEIFRDDPTVLYVSIHADPDVEYPYFTGREADGGEATVNLPLPLGTGDDVYLQAAERAFARTADHAPEALVVSLGLDAHEDDPMGRFALTDEAFRALGSMAAALGPPVLIVQEGGYLSESLGGAVRAFLDAVDQGSSA